ncbi:hypothetical protein MPER_07091 [Moniliophthora perniciosa FA553]|nr:hypothetical protein MPER_07091 [Moniliophthora perniciosa FA553]
MGGYYGYKMAVMEFIDGVTLDTIPTKSFEDPSQLDELEQRASELMDLLEHQHYVHGDVCASNFIVFNVPDDEGEMKPNVVLVDFDLSSKYDPRLPPRYPPWVAKVSLLVADAQKDGIMTYDGQKAMLKSVFSDIRRRFDNS